MSESRLLIAVEVFELLRTLHPREQTALLKRFREIAAFPSRYADYAERDSAGRRIDVHICGRMAIKYWDDFADRQVKVLDVHPAD